MDHFKARPLVVVMDDDEGLLALMAAILEAEGYAVEVRKQWEGAVELVRQVRPQLVILDVVFGREPMGWCVLESLKAHADTAAVPVLICSANHRSLQEHGGLIARQGAPGLQKPFDLDSLLDATAEMLGKWRLGTAPAEVA